MEVQVCLYTVLLRTIVLPVLGVLFQSRYIHLAAHPGTAEGGGRGTDGGKGGGEGKEGKKEGGQKRNKIRKL